MIGSSLTVELPGERLRTIIKDVISPFKVVVEITSLPMTKNHDYITGDHVECHLEVNALGSQWIGKHKLYLVKEPVEEVKKDVRVRKSYK